jgi:sarcosine oxidase subunit alpha
MTDYRIKAHPILPVEPLQSAKQPAFAFRWQGQELVARQGETIAAALFANGVRIFGHHPKDGAPQGIFCANGQCAQCMVLADGRPVKSCMELVRLGMQVQPLEGLPELPPARTVPPVCEITEVAVPVLIIGGGPAGLSAAIELGKRGIETLLIDDRHRLGGKLVLQTHRFFGSIDAVYAGTRGIDIATKLESQVHALESVRVWLNSTAVAVFSDHKVGILRDGKRYVLVAPGVLLTATGARERSLAFKGNTLPGIYGAGAFQTLVNRDLVRPAERLFIVGGGNVGLIAGYHALQAGITVVGLVEAMPACGGYKVHKDKLARLGVPIYTSHTIVSAHDGDHGVESVTIARVDERFRPLPGTERSLACDTVLIAVGLEPVNEFYLKAQAFGIPAFVAGDAQEIAEASSAMLTGRIRGIEVARALGHAECQVPRRWHQIAQMLKSGPGETTEEHLPQAEAGVMPVLHCTQAIPCNPCTAVCPQGLIHIDEADMRQVPTFSEEGSDKACTGCGRCVVFCPGLAITLVDYRRDAAYPTVSIAYEFLQESVHKGDVVEVVDTEGALLGKVRVTDVRAIKANDRTVVVKVQAPKAYARRIAGIRCVQHISDDAIAGDAIAGDAIAGDAIADGAIICRCERVTAGEIRALIRQGCRDINEIKAVTRSGMGACGGKTCTPLIRRLFREEGIPPYRVQEHVQRPLFVEVPLGVLAGVDETEETGGECAP